MHSDLLGYYQNELAALRSMSAEFARRYPRIAGRLQIDQTQSTDPHVERLLQGFAFLSARVQLKIDDDFPEITEGLLNVVYPHYLRPIPSATIVQLELDPEKGQFPDGVVVPAGREMLARVEVAGKDPNNQQRRADVRGTRCRFRTCFPTRVWPIRVETAEWVEGGALDLPGGNGNAVAALKVRLSCFPGQSFGSMQLDSLRLHLDGAGEVPYTLYELITNSCSRIVIQDRVRPGAALTLPVSSIVPVGFANDEGLLPYVRRSMIGYRNLQEYFAFPRKFLFVDLTRLDRLRDAGFGGSVDVFFVLKQFERPARVERFHAQVSRDTIRLGCTPAVNLFTVHTEPSRLDQRATEYRLIPDDYRLRTTQVFSVDSVRLRTQGETIPVEPLYSSSRRAGANPRAVHWVAHRRSSLSGVPDENGNGTGNPSEDAAPPTEMWLSFMDLSGRRVDPEADAFDATATCYNGDLPSRLPIGVGGSPNGDFDLPGGGPFRPVTALVSPSAAASPPMGKSQLWRLVSLLSVNYDSLSDGGADPLRALLRLHGQNESATWIGRDHIDGLLDVRSEPHYARVVREDGAGFARGQRVEMMFDEDKFEGAGMYLFASVLERFLGSYVSINSFSVMAARSKQRRGVVREWAPRAGAQAVL